MKSETDIKKALKNQQNRKKNKGMRSTPLDAHVNQNRPWVK